MTMSGRCMFHWDLKGYLSTILPRHINEAYVFTLSHREQPQEVIASKSYHSCAYLTL